MPLPPFIGANETHFITGSFNQVPLPPFIGANETHFITGSFNQEYKEARQNRASWLEDPITLALRVANYPNVDGINPDEVHIYYKTDTNVTDVIGKYSLMDDSVESEENRVDLIYKEGQWEIEWAGGRWRCRRDAPPFLDWIESLFPNWLFSGWTKSLCS